jgi:hypothetical protein
VISMKSAVFSIAALATIATVFGGALRAQEPIRTEVTRVNMLFTVTDKRGRFVTDLQKDDFQVFENKKPKPSWNSRRRRICRFAWQF